MYSFWFACITWIVDQWFDNVISVTEIMDWWLDNVKSVTEIVDQWLDILTTFTGIMDQWLDILKTVKDIVDQWLDNLKIATEIRDQRLPKCKSRRRDTGLRRSMTSRCACLLIELVRNYNAGKSVNLTLKSLLKLAVMESSLLLLLLKSSLSKNSSLFLKIKIYKKKIIVPEKCCIKSG